MNEPTAVRGLQGTFPNVCLMNGLIGRKRCVQAAQKRAAVTPEMRSLGLL